MSPIRLASTLVILFLSVLSISPRPTLAEPGGDTKLNSDKNKAMEAIRQTWIRDIRSRSARTNKTPSPDNSRNPKGEPAKGFTEPSEESGEPLQKKIGPAEPTQVEQQTQDSQLDNADVTGQAREGGPSFASVALRFAGFLSLSLLILYLVLRFFRLRGGTSFRRGDELVELVVSVPLVQGKFLQVVDVAGQLLVLGVSDSGVKFLTNIEDGVSADRIRLWQSRQSTLASHSKIKVPTFLEKLLAFAKGEDAHSQTKDANQQESFSSVLDGLAQGDKQQSTLKAEQSTSHSSQLEKKLKQQRNKLKKMSDSEIIRQD